LVEKYASTLNEQVKASRLSGSFFKAWEMYHDSFEDNQEQVLDAIYQSFLRGVQQISPMNLSGTVTLFKELGRPDQAAEIVRQYIASRGEDRRLFDLGNNPFAGEIRDPDVIQAFKDKYAKFPDERSPIAILHSMANNNGWAGNDIATLSTLSVDEYYKIFKQSRGIDLRKILDACLQFDRIGNATEQMKEISNRAKDALKRIGLESPINARRVRRYGVEVVAQEESSRAE